MRKITLVTLLVLLLAGGGLYVTVARPFATDLNMVRRLSESFLENLQFKDFRASSLYHHLLDLDRIDIGRAIEELFLVKPEFLDILDFRVSRAEIDSEKSRAKVVMTTRYRVLNKNKEPKEADIILYWIRRHPECPVGATCAEGGCVDEFGEIILKPKEGADEERARRTHDARQDKIPDRADGEPYPCDPNRKLQWYMNMDSTLKQKDYRWN